MHSQQYPNSIILSSFNKYSVFFIKKIRENYASLCRKKPCSSEFYTQPLYKIAYCHNPNSHKSFSAKPNCPESYLSIHSKKIDTESTTLLLTLSINNFCSGSSSKTFPGKIFESKLCLWNKTLSISLFIKAAFAIFSLFDFLSFLGLFVANK